MLKKVYFLSSCSTCKRILNQLDLGSDFLFQDIKTEKISSSQLEKMKEMAGSYEALFSRRAQLYKERNLKDKELSEEDYKNLILEQYTFLKRPVFIVGNEIFVGNGKKTISDLQQKLQTG